MKRIACTAKQKAELVDFPDPEDPIPADHIRGRTLVSLTSPGTELNWNFLGTRFPTHPGYAAVIEVTEVGPKVDDIGPGEAVFCAASHGQFHQLPAGFAVKVPDGLTPEKAVFARLMGVSMSTLNTAAAHPPSRVLVTGLGPVGFLAAQVFHRCGYQVTAADPVESRRLLAERCGIPDVRASVADADDLKGKVGLHVECAGHEQAVLDGCRLMRKQGEVVLVGVPWKRRADLQSFDILHAVFHNYVHLRSGWEWEIPGLPTDHCLHSIRENYSAALQWLAEGSVSVEGLGQTYSPADCQMVYDGLLDQTLPTPSAIFDWRRLA